MSDWVEEVDIGGDRYGFVTEDSTEKLNEAYAKMINLQTEASSANIVSGDYDKVITLQKEYSEILDFHLETALSNAVMTQWVFTAPKTIKARFAIVYSGSLLIASGVSGTVNYKAVGIKA